MSLYWNWNFSATTNDALDSNNQQQQLHQATYQGLPHAPTAHQALELGPMTTDETSNLNPKANTSKIYFC